VNWMEDLNSVMDDSRILTLGNGQRTHMTPNLKLIVEVMNLENVSMSTLSRTGIVHLSDEVLGWQNLCLAWVRQHDVEKVAKRRELKRSLERNGGMFQSSKTRKQHVDGDEDGFGCVVTAAEAAMFRYWFSQLDEVFAFIETAKHEYKFSTGHLVRTFLNVFHGILMFRDVYSSAFKTEEHSFEVLYEQLLEEAKECVPYVPDKTLREHPFYISSQRAFVFAIAWGLGGLLEEQEKVRLVQLLIKLGFYVPKYENGKIVDFRVEKVVEKENVEQEKTTTNPKKNAQANSKKSRLAALATRSRVNARTRRTRNLVRNASPNKSSRNSSNNSGAGSGMSSGNTSGFASGFNSGFASLMASRIGSRKQSRRGSRRGSIELDVPQPVQKKKKQKNSCQCISRFETKAPIF